MSEHPSLDRKDSHLSICLEEQIEFYSANSNGFASYRFDHDGLPEVDCAKIDLRVEFLGKKLAAPLVIGAMTGGTDRTGEINRRLALAAERCQVGFALGSQRKMLRDPSETIRQSYAVREAAPGIPLLFGNLGAVQLNYGVTPSDIRKLIEGVGCDAFNFHINPLQEAIQPEGDRDFSGLLSRLKSCISELNTPVFIKEVGAGISRSTAKKLRSLPIRGVETAGAGGTSWSKIESLRTTDPTGQGLGTLFARWGIPTAESVVICRAELPDLSIVASGGIRNGIEVAKALALGADVAAAALPILKAAEKSVDDAVEAIQRILTELRTTLFVTGMKSIQDLKTYGPEILRKAPDLTAEIS
jgi:isopentenyl-diphosphate delta-isomerase